MKTKPFYFLLLFNAMMPIFASAQSGIAPSILWQKTIGGTATDTLAAFCIGAAKSIVMCGSSKSGNSGNKTSANIGGWDFWIVKTDSSGNITWNKTYGGKKDDVAAAIITTSDGGYLVGGTSISDKNGTKSQPSNKKSNDYWVMKLDANGNKIWDKTYGGIYTDKLTSLAELPSGKYIAGGYSFSDIGGTKKMNNIGSENTGDYWTVILGTDGTLQAQASFGGTSMDDMTCVAASGSSNYYAAGHSYSLRNTGNKTISSFADNDYWLVRSDLSGNILYEGDFGGNRSDYLTSMQVLPDGSLILGGYSNSNISNSKTGGFLGFTDFWIVKLKADGTKQWDKTIGGVTGDYLVSVQQTKDKGFILGGYSNSNISNDKTENRKGGYDYWIVKTDSLGNVLWDKTIGGSGDDKLTAVYELDANQYIAAGTSSSSLSGDKTAGTVGNSGAADYWLLRLGNVSSLSKTGVQPIVSLSASPVASFNIAPNPVTTTLTISYTTGAPANTSFAVYDAGGKTMLKTILPGSTTATTHRFGIAGYSKGVYYAVLFAGDKKVTKTFVKE